MSRRDSDSEKVPAALYDRLTDTPTYAARMYKVQLRFPGNMGVLILPGGISPERKYWLFKSEPTAYSFDDLLNEENQTAEWDGVRDYQVRNFMRDEMREGDAVLFYHSSTNPTAVVGTATTVTQAYPDVTAWDPQAKYYDPKSSPDNPAWLVVDMKADQE